LLDEIDEVLAAAMRREDAREIEYFQRSAHMAQIIVGRGSKVETADRSAE